VLVSSTSSWGIGKSHCEPSTHRRADSFPFHIPHSKSLSTMRWFGRLACSSSNAAVTNSLCSSVLSSRPSSFSRPEATDEVPVEPDEVEVLLFGLEDLVQPPRFLREVRLLDQLVELVVEVALERVDEALDAEVVVRPVPLEELCEVRVRPSTVRAGSRESW
jgi:hypothetical protein